MLMTNQKIYETSILLSKAFNDADLYLPAKINFCLQKNISLLSTLAQEIDDNKMNVGQHYGVLDETNGRYDIPKENIEIATKELNDLFSLEQDVNIKTVSLEEIANLTLSTAQMQAMLFMIEE